MSQSKLTDRFCTTIPVDVCQALGLILGQLLSYEVRADGSAILSAVPGLDALFGSIKLNRPVANVAEEKRAAKGRTAPAIAPLLP